MAYPSHDNTSVVQKTFVSSNSHFGEKLFKLWKYRFVRTSERAKRVRIVESTGIV